MTSSSLCAPVKWAQRSDSLYVTIDLCDVKDEKVSLNDKSLFFEYVFYDHNRFYTSSNRINS